MQIHRHRIQISIPRLAQNGQLGLDLECSGFEILRFCSKNRRGLLSTIPRKDTDFLQNHGVCCGAFLAGAFFLFLRVLAQQMSYFVIIGHFVAKKDNMLSELVIFQFFLTET